MKHGKKLLSIFLSVVLLLGLLPTSALAAETELRGTIDVQTDTSVVTENSNQDYLNPGTYTVGTSGVSFTKIASNGSFNLKDGTVINFNGDWTQDGSIKALDGTVRLNGNNRTLTLNCGENQLASQILFTFIDANHPDSILYVDKLTVILGASQNGWGSSAALYMLLGSLGGELYLNDVKIDNQNTSDKGKTYSGIKQTNTGNVHLSGCTEFSGTLASDFWASVSSSSNSVPFHFAAGATLKKNGAAPSTSNQLKIKVDGNATYPYAFADGEAVTADWANYFVSTNDSYKVVYAAGKLWLVEETSSSSYAITTPTITNAAWNGTTTGLEFGETANLTLSPNSGWKFDTTASLTDLNNSLKSHGLSAKWDNGNLKISGNVAGSVNLRSISGWPGTVEDTYTVNLGSLPTGLTCTEGSIDTSVTANTEYSATFTVADTRILNAAYVSDLNSGILNGTNLEASIVDGKLQISGTVTGPVNVTTNWPAMTETEAMVGTEKYDSLSAAIDAATSGTVVMKKNPTTAVSNKSLNSGVTLKDTGNNTYKAVGDGDASINVATNGSVTLNSGALNVTPKNSTTDASVTVNTGSGSTIVSGRDAFTVTAAKGDGSGGEGDTNAKATVTITNANKSVTTNTGLTFTAGAANSTFPLDGSDLSGNAAGDAITVGSSVTSNQTIKVGTTMGEGGEEAVSVEVPGANTGAVTVTKGNGTDTMATVKVEKAGDKFTVGGKTYVAGADNSAFTIAPDGTVSLTEGGISLGDGESFKGPASNVTIKNPNGSGNDAVTVTTVPAAGGNAAYDEVTVPQKINAEDENRSVVIGEDESAKTYVNTSTTADLKLKITSDGKVAVSGGELGLGDGSSIVGGVSGATILNPANSGTDTVTVKSNGTKDTVTVPKNGDGQDEAGSVTITKNGTSTTYTNGNPESSDFVIDVTADGASLSSGSVELDANEGIGVNTNTITNTSETALVVTKASDGSKATISLTSGQSFTDKDGNTYTAKSGAAEFEVDTDGSIRLISGSAEVTPAASEGAEATIKVAKKSPAGDGDFYTAKGTKPFIVTAGKGEGTGEGDANAKATVTIPTKGDSVSNGEGLTFTAGGENGSTFPLDGSALNNDGDSIAVAGAETNDVTVKVGTTTGEPATDINVTIPGVNTGATTITKGTPTIVKIGANGDKFKVGEIEYPGEGDPETKEGEEYAIDMTTGMVSKIEAKVYDANGNMVGYGGLESMLNDTPASAKTIEMVIKPSSNITDATLKNGVTLKDLSGHQYKANGEGTKIGVDTDGKVSLSEGKLDVTPAATKTASVTVAKIGNASNAADFTTVSGEEPFTVTAGKGDGTGSDANNAKATVTIPTTGNTVTVGTSADAGLTFTAGTNGSTFPLDGKTLTNTGDSVTVGKNCGEHKVALGSGDNAAEITVPAANNGATTVTKGQPTGFDGKVALGETNDTFTVGGKTYTAAADDTTFAVKKSGDTTTVALVSGAVKVSQTGSTDVRPADWSKSVSVSVPAGESDVTVSTVSGAPAKGKAEVADGKSVTIGGKEYTAKAANTAFVFDENGKVTLDSGKVELDKNESILGGVSGVEIKNTSDGDATKVTVEKDTDKDIVTVPAGGTVTIGGKEYTANGGEMKLWIDNQGKVTLNSGKADFGKNTSLNLNGAEIKNTGNSALTMDKGGNKLDVTAGGSFSVGTGTVKDPSANMSFIIDVNGNLTADLTEGKSVTINGVKYTGGAGGATLTLDKDGNLAISGSYTANVPGKTGYDVTGMVTRNDSPVIDATVKLTQGGKETIKLATVTTNAQGDYKFTGVPSGVYNLVVTEGDQIVTKLVTVENGNVIMGDIAMPTGSSPTGSVSSIVEVLPGSSVGAMVGGLDAEAAGVIDSDTVVIKLTVQTKDTADTALAAHTDAQSKTLLPLELNLTKTVNGISASGYTTTDEVLEIIISFKTSDKKNFVVLRKHDGTVDSFEQLTDRPSAPYADKKFYVGDGFVVIYTQKFSDYAIGYDMISSSSSTSSSSGGSGGAAGAGAVANGSVSVSPKNAKKGETVTVTVKPNEGYKLGTLTVTDKDGNKLTLTKISDTQYTYVAPNGKVEVKAEFVKLGTDYASCAKDSTCPITAFTDAKPTAWYHDGMHYCLDNGLMNGFGNGMIGPDHPTTRAQVVVMLWRLNGSPVVNYALDFDDVAEDMWYTEAIRWAKSTGVADGYGNGCFGPDDTITREQMVTILYRYAQNKGYDVSVGESTNILSFADATSVSEFAFPAMQWACGSGMVNGMDGANGTMILLPQGDTIRAQMATMLMRFCVEIVK